MGIEVLDADGVREEFAKLVLASRPLANRIMAILTEEDEIRHVQLACVVVAAISAKKLGFTIDDWMQMMQFFGEAQDLPTEKEHADG